MPLATKEIIYDTQEIIYFAFYCDNEKFFSSKINNSFLLILKLVNDQLKIDCCKESDKTNGSCYFKSG